MNRILTFMILAMLVTCIPSSAQEPTLQYLIDSRIIAIPADEGRECLVVSEKATYKLKENGGGMATFGEIKKLVCGEMTVSLESDGTLLWNGADEAPADSVLELISAPKVSTLAGKKAAIMSGSALLYFTREEDGCFRLHATTEPDSPVESPELTIAYTPMPADDDPDSFVVLEMELTLKALEGREKLPGGAASFDIGPPIISVRSIASKLKLAMDQWHLVSGHLITNSEGVEGDFLLVLLRVQDVKDVPVPTAPQQ